MNKKIEIKMTKSDKSMSGWEISKFLNNLNDKYYKITLLNELAPLLENNGNKIFIMDKSFNISNAYKYMSNGKLDLNKPNNIKYWYYLGLPIAYKNNNQELKNLYSFFKLIRDINSKFLSFKMGKLDSNVISDVYSMILKKEILNIESFLQEKIKTKINEYENPNLKSKEIEFQKQKIEKEIEKIFKNFIKNRFNFNNFMEKFESLERPVIGIYNCIENTIEFICTESISKNSTSEEILDVKKIEHNSPTKILIFAGIVFLPAIIPLLEAKLKNQRATDSEISELKEKICEEIKSYKKHINENKIDEVSEIKNPIENEKLNNLKKQYFNDITQIVRENKMLNRNLEIRLIDKESLKN